MYRRLRPVTAVLFVSLAFLGVSCTPGEVLVVLPPTPVTFTVDNPGGVEGELFGMMLFNPFANAGTFDVFFDGFESGTLNAAGVIDGMLQPTDQVPRMTEWYGPIIGGFLVLPDGCTASSSNAVNAAMAPILGILVWDGETLDGDGNPDFHGGVALSTEDTVIQGNLETTTFTAYFLVMSPTEWSASTGVCSPEPDFTFQLELEMDAGWQALRMVEVAVYDTIAAETVSNDSSIESLTLEEFEGLDIGEASSLGLAAGPSAPRTGLLAQVAPWAMR